MEDFKRKIEEFDDLLQEIASHITSGVLFEGTRPSEVRSKSEDLVNSLQRSIESIMEDMLTLKPERTATIKRTYRKLQTSLNSFKKTLLEDIDEEREDISSAIKHLREFVEEAKEFLKIAREVEADPSRGIMEILKMREICEAKEYISAVPIPELIHARLTLLKKRSENLKLQISSLQESLENIKVQLENFNSELKKFYPSLDIEDST